METDEERRADAAKAEASAAGSADESSKAQETVRDVEAELGVKSTHGCEPQDEGADLVTLAAKYQEHEPLLCERKIVYFLLMIAAGMMGAYTYNLRGGVFCNAQTANFVLMALKLGNGQWAEGFYYLIPIFAYIMGGFVSEILPKPVKKIHFFRWETYLVLIEIIVLFVIGWIPLNEESIYVNHIVQILINFIASMQYNTFRKTDGVPMATTFCTNHCRMVGVSLAAAIQHRDPKRLKETAIHLAMIAVFLLSGIVEVLFQFMGAKAIWIALIPFGIAFVIMAYGDLGPEKTRLLEDPSGH